MRERGWQRGATATGAALGSQLLGLGLSAVSWLPALAHLPHTARSLGMQYEFGSMGSIHPLQLAGVTDMDPGELSTASRPRSRESGWRFRTAGRRIGVLVPSSLVAKLVRREGRVLTFEIRSRAGEWEWRAPQEVTVAFERAGLNVTGHVEPDATTRSGPVGDGAAVRLTVRFSDDAPPETPRALALEGPDGRSLVLPVE